MKKHDIFDISLRLVLGIVCLVMVLAVGRLLRDKEQPQPQASPDPQPEAMPTAEPDIDTLTMECDSVVEDGYGVFYYHPGEDPEWTTEK